MGVVSGEVGVVGEEWGVGVVREEWVWRMNEVYCKCGTCTYVCV